MDAVAFKVESTVSDRNSLSIHDFDRRGGNSDQKPIEIFPPPTVSASAAKIPTPRTRSGRGIAKLNRSGDNTDLRRSHGRELADRVLARADALPEGERAILRAIYRSGHSAQEVAAMIGTPVRTLRRRVKQLTDRVLSREYAFVLLQRDEWTGTRRRVADTIFVEGHSMRSASKTLGLSLHAVRRQHDAILVELESASTLARQQARSVRRHDADK